jgi:type IV secretion system protein TrbF
MKPSKRESISYSYGETITPYQQAKQEWDERIGSARVQAKNWRVVALLSLIIAFILLVSLLVVLILRKDHVFIAEVSGNGEIINVAPLQTAYHPSQTQIAYFVGHFVKLIRSVPLDPVVAKQDWLTAYSFLTQQSANKLNTYLSKNNPLQLLGKKTIIVNIQSVHPISQNTYNVNWDEETTNIDGQIEEQHNMSGIFTVSIKTPDTQKDILKNPLGVFIVNLDISEIGMSFPRRRESS